MLSYCGTRDADSRRREQAPRLTWRLHHDAVEPTALLEAVALAEAYEDGCFAQYREALAPT